MRKYFLFFVILPLLFTVACGENQVGKNKQPFEPSLISARMNEGFFIAAGGEDYDEVNAQMFETTFMGMEYEKKHLLNDEEFELYAGFEWYEAIRKSRPNRSIILRYTSTNKGNIPKEFNTYLEQEMKSLERFLETCKKRGYYFELIEFGDEFNAVGKLHLNFTDENVYEYYDTGIRIIKKYYPDTKICLDVMPVYAYSDKIFSPGAGYDCINDGRLIENITFLKELQKRQTPFTVVGIEIQPGGHTYHDEEVFKRYIDSILELDLEVFIWEFWIPYQTPVKGFMDLFLNNMPPEGYSEEWQSNTLKAFLSYVSQNRRIIGFNYLGAVYGSGGSGYDHTEILIEDGTPRNKAGEIFKEWASK